MAQRRETTEKKRQRILSILWRDSIATGEHDLTSASGLSAALTETNKALDEAITAACETFEKLMDRDVNPTKARERAIKMLSEDYTDEVATLLADYVIEESQNFNETPEA
jgi:ribosome maturation protein Sdo1